MPERFQNKAEQVFFDKVHRFRYTPESEEILAWNNPPPNNTLLSDKFYNSVWRTWNDIQKINSLIVDDCKNINQRLCTLAKIFLILIIGKRFHFPHLPIIYDYERNENQEYRLQFLGKEIFPVDPINKDILKIALRDTEIFIKYENEGYTLKFFNLQLTIYDESGEITT